MKKLLSLCCVGVLLLGLVSCGAQSGSQQTLPIPGSVSSQPQMPEEKPVQPEQEQPQPAVSYAVPLDEAGLRALANVEDVTYSGLADGHSVEVQRADGSYLTMQFDAQEYLELFQTMEEGKPIRIRVEEKQLDANTTGVYLAEYLGHAVPAMQVQSWLPTDYSAPAGLTVLKADDHPNYVLQFTTLEDVTDVNVWEVDFNDAIKAEKDELLYRWDQLEGYTVFAVEVEIPEVMPQLLVEYTLSGGEKQQYFAACNLSGMGPEIYLMEAQNDLV